MSSQVDYLGVGSTVVGDAFSFSCAYPAAIDGDSWLVLCVFNKLGVADLMNQNMNADWFTEWDEVYIARDLSGSAMWVIAAKRADGTESGAYSTPSFPSRREGGAFMFGFQPTDDDGLIPIIDPGIVSAIDASEDSDLDGILPAGTYRSGFYVELPEHTPDRANGTRIALVGIGDNFTIADYNDPPGSSPDRPFDGFSDVVDGIAASPPTAGRATTTSGSDAGVGWLLAKEPGEAQTYAAEYDTGSIDIGGNDFHLGAIVVVNANPAVELTGIQPDIVADVDLELELTASDPDVTLGPVDVAGGADLEVAVTSSIVNYRKPRRELIWLYGLDGVQRGALGP